jgi:glutathione S-transferase
MFLRPYIWDKYEVEKNYPHFMGWYRRLADRPSIAATYAGIAPPSGENDG